MRDFNSKLTQIKEWLAAYDGPDISIMEVCGSHTAAISKYGISGLLSKRLHLISGPGCPVCVTGSAYIDKLTMLARSGAVVVTFGDLLRVPGSSSSLEEEKGRGADVRMVYAPMEVLALAKEQPERTFVFAAVGFETTTPVYALLMEQLLEENITNVRLLTALKTMPPVIRWLCENSGRIDGFLAPGHVAAVTGSDMFLPLAREYKKPFGVAGFGAQELLLAVYGTYRAVEQSRLTGICPSVKNYYPSVVQRQGNELAKQKIQRFFEPVDAYWRGIGVIPASGRILREEYATFDAGSAGLMEDNQKNSACRCGDILKGQALPGDCPLFGKVCTPLHPQGACMVSPEGSCHQYLAYHRTR
jgi:hydrogenase expression/formation protein HypD